MQIHKDVTPLTYFGHNDLLSYSHGNKEQQKTRQRQVIVMHVKILGPMTKQAELLMQNTAIALKKLKVKAKFEQVSEFRKVVAYGVMALPALVIDERVISFGSVLSVEEATTLIKQLH